MAESNDDIKESPYTYEINNMVFESDVSVDTAWYNGMKYQYDQGLITKEDWDSEYSEFISDFIFQDEEEILPNIPLDNILNSDKTTFANGRLRWELLDGKLMDLKYTKVKLFNKNLIGSTCLGTTYTDGEGRFSFAFQNMDDPSDLENGGLDLFIRCYPESYTFKVAPDWVFLYNYGETEVVENVTTGSTTSFYVQQGMVVGQRFASEMGMETDKFLNVIYPFDENTPFCWNVLSGIGASYFDKWDVLIHEYGHFVEGCMGNYGSNLGEIIIYDPSHFPNTDHFFDKDSKQFAMDLTWSESWATAFSLIAQEYYKEEYNQDDPYGIKVPGVADGDFDGWKDYENYSLDPESCEAQEQAVTAFLWDLFDDESSTEPNDNISLGYTDWWEMTTISGTCTLTDFVNIIDDQYPHLRNNIAKILGNHQIAPSNFTITNKSSVSATIPPTLSWTVNGSAHNPNDLFQVVFLDINGEVVYVTNDISSTLSYNQTFTYPISQSVWNEVLNAYDDNVEIYVAVRGYHSQTPVSGPYYSTWDSLNILALEVNKNDPYNCLIESPSDHELFKIVPTLSGYYDILTTGNSYTLITLFDQFRNEIDTGNIELAHYLNSEDIYYVLIRLSNYETEGVFDFRYTTHKHTLSYEYHNQATHIKHCGHCGYSAFEPHNYSYGKCSGCGADDPSFPYIAWEGIEEGIGNTYYLGLHADDEQLHLIKITGEFGYWEGVYSLYDTNIYVAELLFEGGEYGDSYVKAFVTYTFGVGTITFLSCEVEWGNSYPIPEGTTPYNCWIVEKIEVLM